MLRILSLSLPILLLIGPTPADAGQSRKKPNVILIMTDDQGHGDLGFHGNPIIKTPNLDKFAKQSVRMKYFYVCPVCSPTRSSLLTGRYNYRTGVVDTYIGRSMMRPGEVTLAEMLKAAGYVTGIFGKWHLGDNYPQRPIDQGFDEALVHQGGGVGQPADPPGNSYFDPVLFKNGKEFKSKGYCSDVFTDGAIDFVKRHKKEPFFVYLAYNCPHTPLQVPEKYLNMYKNKDLSHSAFPKIGQPLPGKANQDATARVYGMVTNIDDNLGRLFAVLDDLDLTDDTIVIFLTDNGPQQVRYNSGLRGRKGMVYEGGVRVPCFIRWPARLKGNRDIDPIAAHIDIVPTILEACGARKPAEVNFDGKSLMPLWLDKAKDWPDRVLYFQWHRGDEPQMYRAFAARGQRYRLVQPQGGGNSKLPGFVSFQLFDMENDPYEMNDIAAKHPKIVAKMTREYEKWFRDVGSQGYAPPRIYLGAKQQDKVMLTKQDWRGPKASWGPKGVGHWEVKVVDKGPYQVKVLFPGKPKQRKLTVQVGKEKLEAEIPKQAKEFVFNKVMLPQGPGRLQASLQQGKETFGVSYVIVEKK